MNMAISKKEEIISFLLKYSTIWLGGQILNEGIADKGYHYDNLCNNISDGCIDLKPLNLIFNSRFGSDVSKLPFKINSVKKISIKDSKLSNFDNFPDKIDVLSLNNCDFFEDLTGMPSKCMILELNGKMDRFKSLNGISKTIQTLKLPIHHYDYLKLDNLYSLDNLNQLKIDGLLYNLSPTDLKVIIDLKISVLDKYHVNKQTGVNSDKSILTEKYNEYYYNNNIIDLITCLKTFPKFSKIEFFDKEYKIDNSDTSIDLGFI